MNDPKPILLISASDSSAAAGIQMDLRVLNDLGTPARCAITAVTVQGDGGAKSINPVEPEVILEAINTALSDAPGIGAVKIGLLCDALAAEALEEPLAVINALNIPVIVDPVMKSTPGSSLSASDTPGTVLEKVMPWATLLTPNREELEILYSLAGGEEKGEGLKARKLMESGVRTILVTGGDTDEDQCLDILYGYGDGNIEYKHARIGEKAPRGTGCALSTAIAVYLGRGMAINEAVGWSIDYVTGLIERATVLGDQLLLLPGKGSAPS